MDIRFHKAVFAIDLEPVGQNPPHVEIYLNDQKIYDRYLDSSTNITHTEMLHIGEHALEIRLIDKSDIDPTQALQIKKITINGITDDRFIWNGCYRPVYPEPWASEQRAQGVILKEGLSDTDYLGWNGTWRLEFTVPVYTWIHQTCDLGWIYD